MRYMGRPKIKKAETNEESICVRISRELYDRLKVDAREQNRSVSGQVRSILEKNYSKA